MTCLLLAMVLLFPQRPVIATGSGTVTGRILSIEGTPAAGVRVTAITPTDPGQAEGASVHASIAQTDNAGRYRLENLPPGRYYITAGLLDAPTYYPGVSGLSTATIVVVAEGATKDGVDFQLKIPAGVRVSGRLAVLPTSRATPATVVLGSDGLGVYETSVNPDGTFEFLRVNPGSYTLDNFVGLPTLPVTVSDREVTGLEIGKGARGVRVTGRVVTPGSPPEVLTAWLFDLTGVSNALSTTGGAAGGASIISSPGAAGTSFHVRPDATGEFEFLRIPAGTYRLQAFSRSDDSVPATLVVGDQDITNVEIRMPFKAEVSGRVVLEGGRPWAPSLGIRSMDKRGTTRVEARGANGSMGTDIQASGAFTFVLYEGEYQIGLRNLLLGYVLKSISVGDALLPTVKIAPGSGGLTNLVVTIATVPLESIQGVKVSGRITGVAAGRFGSATIVLAGADPGMNAIETTPNADGTFEFSKVPPGNYSLRWNWIPNAVIAVDPNSSVDPIATRLFVGTDNITGIKIPVEVQTPVRGRATVVDANGTVVPAFPSEIDVNFLRSASGPVRTSVLPDGTFSIFLTEGEHTITFDGLPAGSTVKSIVSGSTDLLKNPLKVENGTSPPLIEVKIEVKP